MKTQFGKSKVLLKSTEKPCKLAWRVYDILHFLFRKGLIRRKLIYLINTDGESIKKKFYVIMETKDFVFACNNEDDHIAKWPIVLTSTTGRYVYYRD